MNFFALALESDIGSALKTASGAAFWGGGLNALLNNLTQTFLVMAVAIATLVLIFGGIKWVTGGGDKEALGTAQKMITSALIGLVIIFSTWAILGLVKNFFGIGGSSSGGGGGGGGSSGACLDVCRESACHGYDSFCYKDCRCICNSDIWKTDKERMWTYDNPWCDADTHQYVCRGGSRTADAGGAVSGSDLKCR